MKPTRIQMQTEEILRNTNPSITDCKDSQHDERKSHRPRSLMSVLRFFSARLAEKGQSDLAHGVERRQERGNRECNENNQISVIERAREYLIFRPEASRQKWKPGKRKPADEKSPERDWHLLAKSAHVKHVLRINVVIASVQNAMLHSMNNRTGTEEEQRLEEGMSN